MKVTRSSIGVLFLVIISSCSPQVVGIYNPGSLSATPRSFHVYYPEEETSFSPERKAFDKQLGDILTEVLEEKGLSQSSIPDLYVSFIISVHATEDFNQNNISPYDYRYRYSNFGYYDPNRVSSRSYKEGVLIVDVKNGDNKLVWQGSKSFKLNAKRSSTEELLTYCREIIASFDPQQTN